jgi:hypothetical protein
MNRIENTREQWQAVDRWFEELSRNGSPQAAAVA